MDENGDPVSEAEIRERVIDLETIHQGLPRRRCSTQLTRNTCHIRRERGAELSVGQQRHMMNDVPTSSRPPRTL